MEEVVQFPAELSKISDLDALDIIYLFYSKIWEKISFIPLPLGLDESSDFSDSVGLGFFCLQVCHFPPSAIHWKDG